MGKHIPVLLNEVIQGLNINPNGIYFDLTLGRGGHSKEILKRLTSGHLYGVDQDITAINESRENLKEFKGKFTLVHSNFTKLDEIMKEYNITSIDGILMDLGVSSPQFDDAERGFSYRNDANLDMRMNQEQTLTAEIIVNTYSLNELTNIFREYGEDKYSYQIAKNIIKAREVKPIKTTFELVEIIKRSKPMKELSKPGHPAKQVFQALRIEVNNELGVLEDTLQKAINALAPKGRLAVITFQSLEDRMVKKSIQRFCSCDW
jgi:16S rRNA (cytosine1402-N4)-methyltransferase